MEPLTVQHPSLVTPNKLLMIIEIHRRSVLANARSLGVFAEQIAGKVACISRCKQ